MPLKKGQKLTDNPRQKQVHVRMTEAEYKKLQEVVEAKGQTTTQVIVNGIEMQHKEITEK